MGKLTFPSVILSFHKEGLTELGVMAVNFVQVPAFLKLGFTTYFHDF